MHEPDLSSPDGRNRAWKCGSGRGCTGVGLLPTLFSSEGKGKTSYVVTGLGCQARLSTSSPVCKIGNVSYCDDCHADLHKLSWCRLANTLLTQVAARRERLDEAADGASPAERERAVREYDFLCSPRPLDTPPALGSESAGGSGIAARPSTDTLTANGPCLKTEGCPHLFRHRGRCRAPAGRTGELLTSVPTTTNRSAYAAPLPRAVPSGEVVPPCSAPSPPS